MVITNYKRRFRRGLYVTSTKGFAVVSTRTSQSGPRAASSSFPRSVGFTNELPHAWSETMSGSDRRMHLDA